jgi:hypothetical protein
MFLRFFGKIVTILSVSIKALFSTEKEEERKGPTRETWRISSFIAVS